MSEVQRNLLGEPIIPQHWLEDSTGKAILYDEGVKRAREYIVHHGSIHDIVDAYMENLTDDELMEWLVDPDTGEFVDG